MGISFKNARITDSPFIISMYLKIVLSSQVHAEKMVEIQVGISVYINSLKSFLPLQNVKCQLHQKFKLAKPLFGWDESNESPAESLKKKP